MDPKNVEIIYKNDFNENPSRGKEIWSRHEI